jgi:hypothetical protein
MVIELNKLLPIHSQSVWLNGLAFVETTYIIFIRTNAGIFSTIRMTSGFKIKLGKSLLAGLFCSFWVQQR